MFIYYFLKDKDIHIYLLLIKILLYFPFIFPFENKVSVKKENLKIKSKYLHFLIMESLDIFSFQKINRFFINNCKILDDDDLNDFAT